MALIIKFFTLVVNILCLPLHLIYAVGLYSVYRRMIFPLCLYRISLEYNKKMHDKKKELFANMSKFSKPGGQLTVMEVGCGTGTNFQFFPPGCKVVCVDPNPNFKKFLQKSTSGHEHLTFETFQVASGEDLGFVDDESVDAVVLTLVLCTVSDVPQTLREVHRVLKPGGAFYFLEHVVADPSSWTYFFQHVLQPVWYYFGDGCMLTRSTWKDLEAAGFSELKLRHIEAPLYSLIKAHIMGYAIK